MKKLLAALLTISLNLFAHDDGHGPKIKDAPRRGGRVTSVVLAKEASLGSKAGLIYKAEIVRKKSEAKVLVYLYNDKMIPIKLDKFSPQAEAILISGKAGKEVEQKFELKLLNDHFEGASPKPTSKRYSIDVKINEGERTLLAAFDNLD